MCCLKLALLPVLRVLLIGLGFLRNGQVGRRQLLITHWLVIDARMIIVVGPRLVGLSKLFFNIFILQVVKVVGVLDLLQVLVEQLKRVQYLVTVCDPFVDLNNLERRYVVALDFLEFVQKVDFVGLVKHHCVLLEVF